MAATTGELLITVHAATDLQDCEQFGEQDPFCLLSFTRTPPATTPAGPPPAVATKTAMKGGTNPVWQEEL
jgi:Ca2+-dependent lipid-binding protein